MKDDLVHYFQKWNSDLAESAQEWADECVFKHTPHTASTGNIGQNLYAPVGEAGKTECTSRLSKTVLLLKHYSLDVAASLAGRGDPWR